MTPTVPRLTIIIPYFNRETFLGKTLGSLTKQTGTAENVNLVLVDNNSTDSSKDIAREWLQKECPPWLNVTMIRETTPGASAARNAGLALCTTPWVMFFDSDDIMSPSHISDVLGAISENKDKDLIYWRVRFCYKNKEPISRAPGRNLESDVIHGSLWGTQRYTVKTDFIKKAGAWDNGVLAWNDWELSVRMLLCQPSVAYASNICGVYIISHPASITGDCWSHAEGKREHALEIAINHTVASGKKRIKALIDVKGAVLAANYRNEGNKPASKSLYGQIIGKSKSKMAVRIGYLWQRVIRRGAWLAAAPFIHEK